MCFYCEKGPVNCKGGRVIALTVPLEAINFDALYTNFAITYIFLAIFFFFNVKKEWFFNAINMSYFTKNI